MAKQSDTSREEVLLKEYEFCQSTAQSMESNIWQSSAVIGLGLIGSFILISMRAGTSQPPWYIACMIAPITLVISLLWWLIARRWWSVQHAMFFRMRHIERELGIHSLTYIKYLDHPELIEESKLSKNEKQELVERSSKRVLLGMKDHQRLGVQEVVWVLPILVFISWVIYAFVLLFASLFQAG
jgi:hypothetical protein